MRILLLIIALITLSLAPVSRKPEIRNGRDYALFFACNQYEYQRDLTNPIANSRRIANLLNQRYNFETQIVENPTLDQIDSTLKAYQNDFKQFKKDREGQLLIFFSGHGAIENNVGFYLPTDAKSGSYRRTAVDYFYYRNLIDEFRCQHILVAIDACFSVRFDPKWNTRSDYSFERIGELSDKQRLLQEHQNTTSRIFFTSDGKDEPTPDNSTFAKKFEEGLRSDGGVDQILTSTELYGFISNARPRPYCSEFGRDEPNSSFLFIPKEEANKIAAQKSSSEKELLFWIETQNCRSIKCYQTYLHQYPKGLFAAEAQTEIDKLISLLPKPKMISIPAGTYVQQRAKGRKSKSENTQTSISSFYMAETEVTNQQFCAFLNEVGNQEEGGSLWLETNSLYCLIEEKKEGFKVQQGYENHPVLEVSWYGAQAYANWLSQLTGASYRLPKQEEWEYVAGYGKSERLKYAGTSTLEGLRNYANFTGKEGRDRFSQTSPVKSFLPNELGIYDLSGNAWEWCSDAPSEPSNSILQSVGSEKQRIVRGGGWSSQSEFVAVSSYIYRDPSRRDLGIGFRLVEDIE